MTPIDALRSATSVDADLFGLSNEKIGTLEKGKLAEHHRHSGRSNVRHHRHRTCFVRDERRQDYPKRSSDDVADGGGR